MESTKDPYPIGSGPITRVVLARKPASMDNGHIILCARYHHIQAEELGTTVPYEFVTWWEHPDGATSNGHYYLSLSDAVDEYHRRTY